MYGSSIPVKPLISPACAALYSPLEQGYQKPLHTVSKQSGPRVSGVARPRSIRGCGMSRVSNELLCCEA